MDMDALAIGKWQTTLRDAKCPSPISLTFQCGAFAHEKGISNGCPNLAFSWILLGIYMASAWHLLGICLTSAWHLLGMESHSRDLGMNSHSFLLHVVLSFSPMNNFYRKFYN